MNKLVDRGWIILKDFYGIIVCLLIFLWLATRKPLWWKSGIFFFDCLLLICKMYSYLTSGTIPQTSWLSLRYIDSHWWRRCQIDDRVIVYHEICLVKDRSRVSSLAFLHSTWCPLTILICPSWNFSSGLFLRLLVLLIFFSLRGASVNTLKKQTKPSMDAILVLLDWLFDDLFF